MSPPEQDTPSVDPRVDVCPDCGWGLALVDGLCINCAPRYQDDEEYDPEWACTWCNGEGDCYDGSDPLGDCPDDIHNCHACGGSGRRKDQRIF